MEEIKHQQADYDGQRMQASRRELIDRIKKVIPEDGALQPLPGLSLFRLSEPTRKVHSSIEPSFCVIVQGSKVVYLGDVRYQYDPFNYLIATLELPRTSQVLEASKDEPYLSLLLKLEPAHVSSVMVEVGHITPSIPVDARAMNVSPLDVDLLDAAVRLIRLLDTPGEAQVLMPMITREIIYRLLKSDQSARLYHLAGYTSDIAAAVQRLRQDFTKAVRVEDIAQELGMSVSSFYHHFKAVTAMSPLQYQKRLRLQEARRLMLTEDLDASSAAYSVGYHDASHFNREYKSLFGDPPMRDVQRVREETLESAGL